MYVDVSHEDNFFAPFDLPCIFSNHRHHKLQSIITFILLVKFLWAEAFVKFLWRTCPPDTHFLPLDALRPLKFPPMGKAAGRVNVDDPVPAHDLLAQVGRQHQPVCMIGEYYPGTLGR